MRNRIRSLLALVVVAGLFAASPARAAEPPSYDPQAILRATGRLYASLFSFQVKVRTEIPVVAGKPRVRLFPTRFRDLLPADTKWLEAGTFVHEHEWRVLRDQAARWRAAHPGSKGVCESLLPDRWIHVGYDSHTELTGPPVRLRGTATSVDGAWSFEQIPCGMGSPSADLPLKLFLAPRPETILAAAEVQYLRAATEAEHDCHVLRLTVKHAMEPKPSLTTTIPSRKFRAATWTLWIDRASSLLHRAEIHEEWMVRRRGTPDEWEPAVLDVQETYRDQRLSAPFVLDDFQPEPPDPVPPAAEQPKGDAVPAKPTGGIGDAGAPQERASPGLTSRQAGRAAPDPVPAPVLPENEASARTTLQVIGEPVGDLLRGLSPVGGPQLSAAGELGERRVHVLVRELPRERVLKALAEVVDGVWLRRRQGAVRVLEPDPAALRRREALMAQKKVRFLGGLRTLIRGLSLDPAALERLGKTDSALAYCLTDPLHRAAVQFTSLLGEQQWQELATKGVLSLSADHLGERGPVLMREFVGIVNQVRQSRPRFPHSIIGNRPPLDPEQAGREPLVFRVIADPMTGEPHSFLNVELGRGFGAPAITITGSRSDQRPATRWEEAAAPSRDRAPAAPRVTLTFQQRPAGWGEVLRKLADELHLQLLSEEYTRLIVPPLVLPGGELTGTVPEVLDRLCANYGYQWRLRAGIYEIHSATWYVDRDEEPPGTLIKAAISARGQKQPLSLDWLAKAAAVRPERWEKLYFHAPAARQTTLSSRDLLQFYGTLSPKQRRALEDTARLAAATLSLPQREALAAALRRVAPEWTPSAVAQTRITLSEQVDQARFTFTAEGKAAEAVIPFPSAAAADSFGFGFGAPVRVPSAPR